MPGLLLEGHISGGVNILSGNFFSGVGSKPYSQVFLKAWPANSGTVYVGLSGGVTVLSGGFHLSGGVGGANGIRNGMPLARSETYIVPKLGFTLSGSPAIFVQPDAACSGQAWIFFEPF